MQHKSVERNGKDPSHFSASLSAWLTSRLAGGPLRYLSGREPKQLVTLHNTSNPRCHESVPFFFFSPCTGRRWKSWRTALIAFAPSWSNAGGSSRTSDQTSKPSAPNCVRCAKACKLSCLFLTLSPAVEADVTIDLYSTSKRTWRSPLHQSKSDAV